MSPLLGFHGVHLLGNMNAHAESWYLFEIPVAALLAYLERVTGTPFPASPAAHSEARKWHVALRNGLRGPLHLNVGIPGFEHPPHPIEENASALHAALLLGLPTVRVILSGEWEVAVREGLLTRRQLADGEARLQALEDGSPVASRTS